MVYRYIHLLSRELLISRLFKSMFILGHEFKEKIEDYFMSYKNLLYKI